MDFFRKVIRNQASGEQISEKMPEATDILLDSFKTVSGLRLQVSVACFHGDVVYV